MLNSDLGQKDIHPSDMSNIDTSDASDTSYDSDGSNNCKCYCANKGTWVLHAVFPPMNWISK